MSPTSLKAQLVSFLKSHYPVDFFFDGSESEQEFAIEAAIYWFADGYHTGQSSDLYSILSTSPFKPGPCMTLEKEGVIERSMFEALADTYATGEFSQNDQE